MSKKNLPKEQEEAKIISVEIKINMLHPRAKLPTRQNDLDAGYDLYACESMSIAPMERGVISVGLSMEIPIGYYGRIAPRSGLAAKKGIDVLGGVIDPGYRDEIKIILINLNLPESLFNKGKSQIAYEGLFGSRHRLDISEGDRVAQLIIERCASVSWVEDDLSPSDRGNGGFGSTGT